MPVNITMYLHNCIWGLTYILLHYYVYSLLKSNLWIAPNHSIVFWHIVFINRFITSNMYILRLAYIIVRTYVDNAYQLPLSVIRYRLANKIHKHKNPLWFWNQNLILKLPRLLDVTNLHSDLITFSVSTVYIEIPNVRKFLMIS